MSTQAQQQYEQQQPEQYQEPPPEIVDVEVPPEAVELRQEAQEPPDEAEATDDAKQAPDEAQESHDEAAPDDDAKQPDVDIDEPHTEHMDDMVAPEHIDEPMSPERGSQGDAVEDAGQFETFDAPTYEAPDFSSESAPPAAPATGQGGYPRVVEVRDSGVRYTLDLQTGERRARKEPATGLGEDSSLRVVQWSDKPVKSRFQPLGSGVVILGRGGVRFEPGAMRERSTRDTGAPRSRPERM